MRDGLSDERLGLRHLARILGCGDEASQRSCDTSLQFRVLGLGLLQDGDVGVGVFPEGKEILICGPCLYIIAQELVPACLADIGKRNKWVVRKVAVQISNMLKVLNCCLRFAGFKIAGH